ncbi:uncharacterized protein PHACADRAFT_257419 [Phanerochaete carnosa HHB-10118-sp]|uniref:T6SS Phospholipase effector Tle1-like catalytic domain-containing protein n=1 Tax=Phanerochaete carnosa (strain HHB-10118-sp) TaxID=650164 RepID=K5W4Q3_PHACS|nr:uncharacterized protein PHACADRAFT_257419 [Phanerochaete carnosa HHB-10118-sp]EKM53919.1 hypothetical protein PHACADRAFT_257419 [Phanerochaete carnosa HHB-10118-sp]
MALPPPVITTLPSIIPPADPLKPRPRTLVLCFDGTGDQFDADNSNVIQFFTLLQKDDHTQQMVYYQAGIGTYTIPQIATPLWAKLNQTVDAAIAWNLDAHVMQGYEFLMQNYQGGDKICIFGFSRGAYIARSLAGMIHKVGLLPSCNSQQVPFAYKMYTRADDIGWKQSAAFKKAFSMDVDIEFVGVWDTVCSVGLFPRRLPFVSSNTAVRYFRHALSLDERRAKFKANLYNRPTDQEVQLGVQPGEMPKPQAQTALAAKEATITAKMHTMYDTLSKSVKRKNKHDKGSDSDDEDLADWKHDVSEYAINGTTKKETDVLEVWFSGCHCDVGGGSVPNDTRHNLARIPLRWMIRQCFLANTGIRFHTELLKNVGLDPAMFYPDLKPAPRPLDMTNIVSEEEYLAAIAEQTPKLPDIQAPTLRPPTVPLHVRTDSTRTLVDEPLSAGPTPVNTPVFTTDTPKLPATPPAPRVTTLQRLRAGALGELTEAEEDLADLLCPLYDQLALAPAWWVLEVIPLEQHYQLPDNAWVHEPVVNWGRGRHVPVCTDAGVRMKVHCSVDLRMRAKRVYDWTNGTSEERAYVPQVRYHEKTLEHEEVKKEIEWVV